MEFDLEKSIWTESDFEDMGWHDSVVYKIQLSKDLELDIDYIFQWNKPDIEGLPFTFWVAPSTLVFDNVNDLKFGLEIYSSDIFEILDVEGEILESGTYWTIRTRQGEIFFKSEGYKQYIRQKPSFEFGQSISFVERNGYSLEKTTSQINPNILRPDIWENRSKNLEFYEDVKKRHIKRYELGELENLRKDNLLSTKNYLLKRKQIRETIKLYDNKLKDTIFENW